MNKIDLVRLSVKNFLRRKVRTILTILGVVIGTAAIVVMLSLGLGMTESFKQQLSTMGSLNVITLDKYNYNEVTSSGQVKEVKLNDKTVQQLKAIEGIEAVTPTLRTTLKFGSGKYISYVSVIGIDPAVMDKFDFKLESGRLLTKDDTNAVVFGSSVSTQFYNPRNTQSNRVFMMGGMGQEQKGPVDLLKDKLVMTTDMMYGEKKQPGVVQDPNTKPAKIYKALGVGLLQQSNDEKSWSAYMNIDYLKKLMMESVKSQSGKSVYNDPRNGYEQILVKVKDFNDVQKIQNEIKKLGYSSSSLMDILKSMQKQAKTLQLILGGIGAISLLVAALGIANTMIMSIYERTREIGIMKVLGCLLGDIRRMFLMEAGFIGFMGGIVGLLFSFGVSFLINTIGGNAMGSSGMGNGGEQTKISVIPVWLALASVGFATLVGLISGFYPANRAMKLSALEAIKTE
jgi:ABC-type transport system, involved in lipoprotein release, permease component